jgi:hypothetical protein
MQFFKTKKEQVTIDNQHTLISEVYNTVNTLFNKNRVITNGNGLLESLVSRCNVPDSIFASSHIPQNLKNKTLKLSYESPVTKLDVSTAAYSAEKSNLGVKQFDVSIDNFASVKATATKDDLEGFTNGYNTQLITIIEGMVTKLILAIDRELIASFDMVRGDTSYGSTIPLTLTQLAEESEALDITRKIIVVGREKLDLFTQEYYAFVNRNMSAETLGSTPANMDVFAYHSGMIQFVDYSYNKSEDIQLMVTVGEDTSFPVDLSISLDETTGLYTIEVYKMFKLLTIPINHYPIEHPYFGVNYMYRVRPTT